MKKTFNIYCDESCHLRHDHKRFMFIGSVSCAYPQVRRHCRQIEEIKRAHNFFAEIKWSHVSMSKIDFYQDLVNYFFDTDLRFRAIGVEKNGIPCGEYGEGYDEFYYKTAYQLLNHKISTLDHYNVYLDKKDTLGQYKVRRLCEILNVRFGVFRNVQTIDSRESLLLQLTDLLIGAVSYDVNDEHKLNRAKLLVIERIKRHAKIDSLTTSNDSNKLNLFFVNP